MTNPNGTRYWMSTSVAGSSELPEVNWIEDGPLPIVPDVGIILEDLDWRLVALLIIILNHGLGHTNELEPCI